MNYIYCYEKNGYKGARNQLHEDERAYLNGYKQAVEDVEKYIKYNIDLLGVDDEESMLGKLKKEIVQEAGNKLLYLLNSDWHEAAISFLDDHGDDTSDGAGKCSKWKIPEPPKLDDEEDKERIADFAG